MLKLLLSAVLLAGLLGLGNLGWILYRNISQPQALHSMPMQAQVIDVLQSKGTGPSATQRLKVKYVGDRRSSFYGLERTVSCPGEKPKPGQLIPMHIAYFKNGQVQHRCGQAPAVRHP